MAELRWILLGAGVALILGLWWWETRKSRMHPTTDVSGLSVQESTDVDAESTEVAPAFDEQLPYAPTIERVRVPRRPPLIEIPEDLEVDVSDFVRIDRRHPIEPEFPLDPEPGVEPAVADSANEKGPFSDEMTSPMTIIVRHGFVPSRSTAMKLRPSRLTSRMSLILPTRTSGALLKRPSNASWHSGWSLQAVTGAVPNCARPWRRRAFTMVPIRYFTVSARTARRFSTSRA